MCTLLLKILIQCLFFYQYNIVNTNLTADLTCLNLSGVEMLTDALFFTLKNSGTYFRMVKKIICAGNILQEQHSES